MSQTFEYPIQLKLHDTDAAGVMFFGHLFRHAHDAYEALLQQRGLPLRQILEQDEFQLPIVHAEADFLAPIRLGEAIHVRVQITHIGERSFRLRYTFVDDAGQIRARAYSAHACLDARSGETRPLPETLRQTLGS